MPHGSKCSGDTRPNRGARIADHLFEHLSKPGNIVPVRNDEILNSPSCPSASGADSARIDVVVVAVPSVLAASFFSGIWMIGRQPGKHLNRVFGKGLLYTSEQFCHSAPQLLARLSE